MSDPDSPCRAGGASSTWSLCAHIIHIRNRPLDHKPVKQFASKRKLPQEQKKTLRTKVIV